MFISSNSSIYFHNLSTDLREGCEGLASISASIVSNPPENTLFMFLNRRRNRIKILCWSSTCLSYWFIRSRKGVFAPKKSLPSWISLDEMQMILNGNFPKRLKSASR